MILKLRYLLAHVGEVVDVRRETIIIFINRPLTLLYVEYLLVEHDYNDFSIRSAHTVAEREAAHRAR